jgi:flagellar hook protein FlgE
MNMDVTNYTSVDVGTKFTQDGAPEGNLTKYDVLEDGRIVASFTNAVSVTLAQIPIYHFQNEQGLDTIGSNLFTPTSNSNDPILYDKEHTKILSHALESSNVSFSQAMTELIVTQKAFSASAKTVTTSDQMIQKAIDMKR